MRPALFFSQAGTTLVGMFHSVPKMGRSVIPVGKALLKNSIHQADAYRMAGILFKIGRGSVSIQLLLN
jgi:hypothetical protein